MGGRNASPGTCGETESGAPPFALIDSVALNGVAGAVDLGDDALGFVGLGYAGLRNRRRISDFDRVNTST